MDGPQRNYVFPIEYTMEEEMISEGQRHTLTDLIYTYIQGESEQQARLMELGDLSFSEAENYILDFSFARW